MVDARPFWLQEFPSGGQSKQLGSGRKSKAEQENFPRRSRIPKEIKDSQREVFCHSTDFDEWICHWQAASIQRVGRVCWHLIGLPGPPRPLPWLTESSRSSATRARGHAARRHSFLSQFFSVVNHQFFAVAFPSPPSRFFLCGIILRNVLPKAFSPTVRFPIFTRTLPHPRQSSQGRGCRRPKGWRLWGVAKAS